KSFVYALFEVLLVLILSVEMGLYRLETGIAPLLKPVDHIADGLHRLDQGHYDYVLKLNTRDEFKNIEEDFNKMAATIRREIQSRIQKELTLIQRENEILKLNTQLERRVHERTAQLERANQELEAFSYSVSHDLRSPLRAMEGLSHVLLEDYGPALIAQAKDYLQRIQGAAERMGHLIDDMLRLSRIGRTALRRELVDLSALARSVLEGLQASDSKRTVEVCIAENLRVEADLNLMGIALENMLGNAWKFTAKTEHARIEFGRMPESQGSNPGAAPFYVRDNGVGFDMAYVDKLFGVFQRLHRAEEFPGTGIGLSIVARIVHLHGGEIWAESGVDQGATFFFTLSPSRANVGDVPS
ncbi:MAG: sensor histidine kinase, partial [Verrucomicrobiota bacterium]